MNLLDNLLINYNINITLNIKGLRAVPFFIAKKLYIC